MSTIDLNSRRKPVVYTIEITHYWDDKLEIFVHGVSDDQRSQSSVNDAIARLAETRMDIGHIHRAILNRIDALMGALPNTPEMVELGKLADACMEIEM
jgi:hypothetical protein